MVCDADVGRQATRVIRSIYASDIKERLVDEAKLEIIVK